MKNALSWEAGLGFVLERPYCQAVVLGSLPRRLQHITARVFASNSTLAKVVIRNLKYSHVNFLVILGFFLVVLSAKLVQLSPSHPEYLF